MLKLCNYAWYIVLIANVLVKQSIAYFPRKYRRTLSLVRGNLLHDIGRGHARLTTANGARFYAARFVIATKYFAHATI